VVFLPGYMSDMAGSKATALLEWAEAQGRECLLFDYSGCGESPGDFAEGTLTRWQDEAAALIDGHTEGLVILVGSSMGGWLMLLLGRALGARLAGLVGIAAAPDFTEWGYSEDQQEQLAAAQQQLEQLVAKQQQLAAKQEQMAQNIAKLQTREQTIRPKTAAPPQLRAAPILPRTPAEPAAW